MSSEGSVTTWIGQLRAGDPDAAQKLWEAISGGWSGWRAKKLQDGPRRAADEEDVALSAFASFCHEAARGQFPQLADRHDLWRLLVTITARKALHLRRDEERPKRGGGQVLGEAELLELVDAAAEEAGLEQVVGREPTPAFAALVAEECRRLLSCLEDPALQALALLKMEGYTNDEIAGRLGCERTTVQRKLRLIRTLWKEEGGS